MIAPSTNRVCTKYTFGLFQRQFLHTVTDLNQRLRNLMARYELTQKEVADLTGYSLDMVKAWCAEAGSERYRPMKDRAWRLLMAEIKAYISKRDGETS